MDSSVETQFGTPQPTAWQAPDSAATDSPAPTAWHRFGAAPPNASSLHNAHAFQRTLMPLQPLGLGGIFDVVFVMVKRYNRTFLGLGLIVMAIALVLSSALLTLSWLLPGADAVNQLSQSLEANDAPQTPGEIVAFVAGLLAQGTAYSAPYLLGGGVLSVLYGVPIPHMLLGRACTLQQSINLTRPHIWRAMRVSLLLSGLYIMVIAVNIGIIVATAIAATSTSGNTVAIIGIVLVGVLLLVLTNVTYLPLYYLVGPIAGIEQRGAWASLRRALQICRRPRSYWYILGTTLLMMVLLMVAISILQVPFTLPVMLLAATGIDPDSIGLVTGLVSIISLSTVMIFVYPYTLTYSTMIYLNVCMKTEALDIKLRQELARG